MTRTVKNVGGKTKQKQHKQDNRKTWLPPEQVWPGGRDRDRGFWVVQTEIAI